MTTRKLAGAAVAILALLLVAAPLVFAQSGTTTSTVTTTQSTATPSVTVTDQPIKDGTVTVAKVISNGPGWMTIHLDVNGQDGAVIGHTPVHDGENDNVVVQIDVAKATPVLHGMLHVDKGIVGTYEFPGADIPVTVNGQIVDVAFNVTGGLPSASGNVTTTATMTATAAVTATTAVSPTATTAVTPTTAVSPTAASAATPSASGTPVRLPTTGGTPVPWSLVVLGLGGLIMIGGLGLALARRS